MDAATTWHVISEIGRVLDAEVAYRNQEHRMGRQDELREKFIAPDLKVRFYGNTQFIVVDGQEITINSMATDEQIAVEIAKIRKITEKPTTETKSMSILGLETGAFQAKLAEIRKRAADGRAAGLTKMDGAVTAGLAKIDAAAEVVVAKVDKEVEAQIGEFAAFGDNGGEA